MQTKRGHTLGEDVEVAVHQGRQWDLLTISHTELWLQAGAAELH